MIARATKIHPSGSFDSRFQLEYHGRHCDYALRPKIIIVSCPGTTEDLTMRRLGVVVTLVVVIVLVGTTASAQQVPVKDVRSVLEASMKAMGGTNLKTIQYS